MRHVGGHGPKPHEDDRMADLNPQRCDEGWTVDSIRNAGRVRGIDQRQDHHHHRPAAN
jgi:hypothetical protein